MVASTAMATAMAIPLCVEGSLIRATDSGDPDRLRGECACTGVSSTRRRWFLVVVQLVLLAGFVWFPGERAWPAVGWLVSCRRVDDRGCRCCRGGRSGPPRRGLDRFTTAVGGRPTADDRCVRLRASPDLHRAAPGRGRCGVARRSDITGLGVVRATRSAVGQDPTGGAQTRGQIPRLRDYAARTPRLIPIRGAG